METVLLWLTRLSAIGVVLPAFFMTWYLAGSDDIPRSVIAPIFGLGVLASAIWGLVKAFQLPADPYGALLVFSLPIVLSLVVWPVSGNRAMGREPILKYVAGLVWLAPAFVVGALYVAI